MNQSIYIGPNVFKLGLIRNQVFAGGLTGQVKAAAAQFPQVLELIVPVEQFTESEKLRDTKGEHLHKVHQSFIKALGRVDVQE